MSDWPFGGTSAEAQGAGTTRLLLEATDAALSRARSHVHAACAGLPQDVVDTALLVTSELVANAVRHPRPQRDVEAPRLVGVECDRAAHRLRVAVSDHDPRLPILQKPHGPRESGWGLQLLVRLVHACGADVLPDRRGKVVWFELRLPTK